MEENTFHKSILLLKRDFPEFEAKIDSIYAKDDLFKEIANEYFEIVSKLELDNFKTDKTRYVYTDTMNELKEELLDYLNELKSYDSII